MVDSVSAYIHIPFCRRRCFYCDFPITVVGDKSNPDSPMLEEYVRFLCTEIEGIKSPNIPLQTVFFGGGTPSLLPVKFLARILTGLDKVLGIDPDAEISLEIDPGTFTLEQLQGYQSLGVNRFSLGVQGFQDQLLAVCGRSHRLADIEGSIDLIRQAGVTNFSLDLISGLPNQTLQQWEESLQKAVAIAPSHLSCYDLVVESVTPFGKQYQPGIKPLPDDETTANMYRLAASLLTAAGYEHYEISNYARDGRQCAHNRVYWQNEPYYGFGMGAASYIEGRRLTRPRTRRQYYDWVESGCIIDCPPSSSLDQLLETLMLGLRLKEGVNLKYLSQKFGSGVIGKILKSSERYLEKNWLQINEDKILKLTDPEGFLFSNTVLTHLFQVIEKIYPNPESQGIQES
ncbi:MAG: coproporphyrinogen III oxidase [Chlorogloea purpurea SAG 13.99]|nr:coproporphyrinogen III oxidase [Chlorogloea purpurea SAG 13.99]